MSALVWLPLNGNLQNNGLSILSTTSSPSYTSGKLGKCLSNSVTLNVKDSFIANLTTTNEYSIGSWINVRSSEVTWIWRIYSSGVGNARGLWGNNSMDSALYFGYAGSGISPTTNIPINVGTWYHVMFTIHGTVTTLYVNGQRQSSNTEGRTAAINSNQTYIHLNGTKAYINDFRVYDYCLSAKEVYEISKGLILHYPMNLNYMSDIAFDCSGMGNHGTVVGTPTFVEDTPIGQCSTNLNNKTYIRAGRGPMVTDLLTVSFWRKNGGTAYRPASCTESGGWNFEYYNKNFRFLVYRKGDRYVGPAGTPLPNTGWSLHVGTYDGYVAKLYMDGKLVSVGKTMDSKKELLYHPNNGIFISAEAGISLINPAGISTDTLADFRIYATALSEDDVKELYHTRFSADNNIYGTSFVETDSTKLSNTGIANSPEFVECPVMPDMKVKVLDDNSAWARIFYQKGDEFFSSTDNFATEPVIKDSYRYSRLYLMEYYKYNGVFELMLEYPDSYPGKYNRWTQTSNGVTTVNEVTGYTPIHIDWTSNGFKGLNVSNSGKTWLDCLPNHVNYWYAIGCYTNYQGGTPGPTKALTNGVELWVRIYPKLSIYKDKIYAKELIEK